MQQQPGANLADLLKDLHLILFLSRYFEEVCFYFFLIWKCLLKFNFLTKELPALCLEVREGEIAEGRDLIIRTLAEA